MYYPVWQVNVAAVHGWESNAQWKSGEEEECNCECHLITLGSVQNHIQTVDIWYFQLSNKYTNHFEFSHFRRHFILQIKEGDIIDVVTDHTVPDSKSAKSDHVGARDSMDADGDGDQLLRRARVIVTDVGEQTKKGRWHVTLLRHKNLTKT